jgi:hypothetical protein
VGRGCRSAPPAPAGQPPPGPVGAHTPHTHARTRTRTHGSTRGALWGVPCACAWRGQPTQQRRSHLGVDGGRFLQVPVRTKLALRLLPAEGTAQPGGGGAAWRRWQSFCLQQPTRARGQSRPRCQTRAARAAVRPPAAHLMYCCSSAPPRHVRAVLRMVRYSDSTRALLPACGHMPRSRLAGVRPATAARGTGPVRVHTAMQADKLWGGGGCPPAAAIVGLHACERHCVVGTYDTARAASSGTSPTRGAGWWWWWRRWHDGGAMAQLMVVDKVGWNCTLTAHHRAAPVCASPHMQPQACDHLTPDGPSFVSSRGHSNSSLDRLPSNVDCYVCAGPKWRAHAPRSTQRHARVRVGGGRRRRMRDDHQ